MSKEQLRARFLFQEVHERGFDLPLASVTRDGGVEFRADLDTSVWNPDGDTSNYKRVRPGDFVIGLRSFQSGIGYSDLEGLVSPAYTVLRASSPNVHHGFFKHLFKSDAFISRLENVAQGIRQGRTIATEDFYNIRIALPSLSTQQAIADYLDTETARIDALIEKKKRMTELFEERFKSAVSNAQSGWDRVPLKRAVVYREGPGIMAADFREEGIPLVRVAGVRGEFVTLEGCQYLEPEMVASRWSQFRLRLDDYLISASASMGVASKVSHECEGAIPYTGLIIVRPQPGTDMEYIRFFLTSSDFMRQIDQLKTGTAIQHYGPTHLDQVSVPLPPDDRQLEIGAYLLNRSRATEKVLATVRNQIDLLGEKRQALITAAVTGELEIPGVAA